MLTLREHVCVRVCPTWVEFCSLVSQFVKVSLIICLALSSPLRLNPTYLSGPSVSY